MSPNSRLRPKRNLNGPDIVGMGLRVVALYDSTEEDGSKELYMYAVSTPSRRFQTRQYISFRLTPARTSSSVHPPLRSLSTTVCWGGWMPRPREWLPACLPACAVFGTDRFPPSHLVTRQGDSPAAEKPLRSDFRITRKTRATAPPPPPHAENTSLTHQTHSMQKPPLCAAPR